MRRGLVLALALVLVGLIGWRMAGRESTDPVAAGAPALTAYAREVILTTTDAEGEMAWQVTTPAARYYDSEGVWQFDAPAWRLPSREGAPWVGRADHGRSWSGHDRARLQGNVLMQREGPAGMTRFETQRVDLDIPARYAETDDPVLLTGPGYRIEGTGAQAWLEEQRIVLPENAEGQYNAASQ